METPRRPSLLSFLPKILVLPAALLLAASPAEARLVLDLRATTATGGATVVDPKTVTLLGEDGVGATINFDLYAMVLPTNGGNGIADEGLSHFIASLYSYGSAGKNIRANFSPVILPSEFTSSLSFGGASADLNGDGDLDIGGPFTRTGPAPPTGIPYLKPFGGTRRFEVPGISHDLPGGIGREWLVGTTSLTVNQIVDIFGDPISANFFVPDFSGTVAKALMASFMEDGVQKDGIISTPGIGFQGMNVFAGAPVTVAVGVPEPGALTLVILGAIGVVGRRRRIA